MTNKKSHMRFPLTPRSTTLDDLEVLAISSKSLWISRDSADLGATNGYANEDRPVLSIKVLQMC